MTLGEVVSHVLAIDELLSFVRSMTGWLCDMPPNIWGTVPQWLSAAISGFALLVAWRASSAWRKTLISKRGDDAIVALFNLEAAIGRMRSTFISNPQTFEREFRRDQFNSIYKTLLEWQKSLEIITRSNPIIDKSSAARVETMLTEISKIKLPTYFDAITHATVRVDKSNFDEFIKLFENKLDNLQAQIGKIKLDFLTRLHSDDKQLRL